MQKNVSLHIKFPKIDSDGNNNDPYSPHMGFHASQKNILGEQGTRSLTLPNIRDEGHYIQSGSLIAKRQLFAGESQSDLGFHDGIQLENGLVDTGSNTKSITHSSRAIKGSTAITSELQSVSKVQTPKTIRSSLFRRPMPEKPRLKQQQTAAESRNSVRQKFLQINEKRVQHGNFYERGEESRAKCNPQMLHRQEAFDFNAIQSDAFAKVYAWLDAWFTKEGIPREMSPDPIEE